MGKKKEKRIKDCGQDGRSARATIRKLLSRVKVDKKKAAGAIDHLKRCQFCKTRIKTSIYETRKGRGRASYLDSIGETLQEAKRIARID